MAPIRGELARALALFYRRRQGHRPVQHRFRQVESTASFAEMPPSSPKSIVVRMADPDVDLTIVTMVLDAAPESVDDLMGVLAKYVVISRQHQGCRNIDLCHSQTHPGRFLLVQKWDSPASQRDHFDSDEMVQMALSCREHLAQPAQIDLFEGLSAHDLN